MTSIEDFITGNSENTIEGKINELTVNINRRIDNVELKLRNEVNGLSATIYDQNRYIKGLYCVVGILCILYLYK